METKYSKIWISSVEHLDAFSTLSKQNPWWKLLFGINKVPANFPQIKMGNRKYPVVFYAEGSLTLFEREIEFKADLNATLNNGEYFNLIGDLRLEFHYELIKVDRFTHPKPFMKAFNISWIKIVPKNIAENPILLSVGGSGFNYKQIEKANEELYQLLKMKTEYGQ